MNSLNEIRNRNKDYLKNVFNMTESDWINIFKNSGLPPFKYRKGWSLENPTYGWCGTVIKALRLSNKIPEGYVYCKNLDDPHFYFINEKNKEVIDLTVYQFNGEYPHVYENYTRKAGFWNVITNEADTLMNMLKIELGAQYIRDGNKIMRKKL